MSELPFLTRLWFAWACFFRVLFDGRYAAQLYEGKALPPAPEPAESAPPPKAPAPPKPVAETPSYDPALQLLGLLQREGRLVDFLEEDVASFSDGDIGAAARGVHAGCRKALREHVVLEPVRSEEEGAKVTLDEGFDPAAIKLTGDVKGKGPYTGTLRHRGWRVAEVKLPKPVAGHDARVVAQAEVEL